MLDLCKKVSKTTIFKQDIQCWFHPGTQLSASSPYSSLKWHNLKFIIRNYLLQVESNETQECERKMQRPQSQQQVLHIDLCNV